MHVLLYYGVCIYEAIKRKGQLLKMSVETTAKIMSSARGLEIGKKRTFSISLGEDDFFVHKEVRNYNPFAYSSAILSSLGTLIAFYDFFIWTSTSNVYPNLHEITKLHDMASSRKQCLDNANLYIRCYITS